MEGLSDLSRVVLRGHCSLIDAKYSCRKAALAYVSLVKCAPAENPLLDDVCDD